MKASTGAYYRTGKAAKILAVSPYHVRCLLEAGLLDGQMEQNGRWKIPIEEVRRLQSQGVPPIPEGRKEAGQAFPRPHHPAQAEPPASPCVLAAQEDTAIAAQEVEQERSEVERLRLQTQRVKLQRELRKEREQDDAEQQAPVKAARAALAAAQEARRRTDWEEQWLTYALGEIPYDAPEGTDLDVSEAVSATLEKRGPEQASYLTQSLVDSAIARTLAPHFHEKRKQDTIRLALMSALPLGAPDGLKLAARQAAEKALSDVRPQAEESEMKRMVQAAVQPLVSQYEAEEAREQVIQSLGWELPWISEEATEEAKTRIRRLVAKQPQGTDVRRLRAAAQRIVDVENRAAQGRREIYPYLLRLEDRYEFEASAAQIEREIEPAVLEGLRAELEGNESQDELCKLVHRLVRRALGI